MTQGHLLMSRERQLATHGLTGHQQGPGTGHLKESCVVLGWFSLLEGGPGGRKCKPSRGLGVYGCGLEIADGVEKAGRDNRLTVCDAPQLLFGELGWWQENRI